MPLSPDALSGFCKDDPDRSIRNQEASCVQVLCWYISGFTGQAKPRGSDRVGSGMQVYNI